MLVFDEATSALDSETEREIIAAIEDLKGSKTLIIIAHRLSTVQMCIWLIFIKDGTVNDLGEFERLMDRNEDYQRMVKLSSGELVETSS